MSGRGDKRGSVQGVPKVGVILGKKEKFLQRDKYIRENFPPYPGNVRWKRLKKRGGYIAELTKQIMVFTVKNFFLAFKKSGPAGARVRVLFIELLAPFKHQ